MFLKESPDHLETGCPKSNEAVKQNFFCVSALGPHALDRRDSVPSFVPMSILWFLTGCRVHLLDVCPTQPWQMSIVCTAGQMSAHKGADLNFSRLLDEIL